ncbi:hypothetical protein J3Q64DRAFT_1728159 [Phycomyces blakesleeanus]|uniref:COX assembly mitochondrial protein n=2 Tax=Phycomyces blakesleeanus TaxID=4837 RepID=A0A167LCN8_PHYB8|nr:hypothetical protein PHYBLDRAFT_148711 [Phycomyces blakesleeanus NRRL 1555(-)]OAD70155.1 hypothetical protein PHYBLDRAFT_148711 [Phycomyces blakesleeanus NRRL 1555(-)]|eukprot:XP_018288195.1 hypothetical protein PHYBLDRAFT_148711 [Phycomyces blakesleeanus NRRL 1555(-)]
MGKTVQESKANPMGDRSNELHALTRAEEEACNKAMKKAAIEYCQDSMKEFVQCSKEHNVTVMWTCRDKLKTMNNCLKGRTSREELDKLKLEKLMAKRAELAK